MAVVEHDHRRAARPQDAVDLVDSAREIAGVVQAADASRRVRTRRRDGGSRAPSPGRRARSARPPEQSQALAHDLDRPRRDVEPVVVEAGLRQPLGHRPVAEADLEQRLAGAPRADGSWRGQVRIEVHVGRVEARRLSGERSATPIDRASALPHSSSQKAALRASIACWVASVIADEAS